MTYHPVSKRMCRVAVLTVTLCMTADIARTEPTKPDPVLLEFYDRCSTVAESRMLSPDKASRCAQAYQAIKLSFLSSKDRRSLAGAAPVERAALLAKAYAAYVSWRAAALSAALH